MLGRFALLAAVGPALACGDSFTPLCGDGVISVEVDEQCDDANTASGDGCSSGCRLEVSSRCGNDTVDDGEVCDDGNQLSGDGCSGNCLSLEVCGNGLRDFGEACDDGDTLGGDGCTETCEVEAACGNGVLEPGEACDDGNASDLDDCLVGCTPARCGDGFVQLGVEQCDDGNNVNEDLCPTTCVPCLAGMGQRASRLDRARCLLEFTTPATWSDAEAACVGLGGHLARARDLDENRAIDGFSDDLDYWIGLSDAASEGDFVWSDGSVTAFERWAAGEPNGSSFFGGSNEDCALMYVHGTWNDAVCTVLQPYVCEVALAGYADVGGPGTTWQSLTATAAAAGFGLPSYVDGNLLFDLSSEDAVARVYDIAGDAWTDLASALPLDETLQRAAPIGDALVQLRRGRVTRFDTATRTWSELTSYGERADASSGTDADAEGRAYAVEADRVLVYDAVTGDFDEWPVVLPSFEVTRVAYDPKTHALWIGEALGNVLQAFDLGTRSLVAASPALGVELGTAVCADRVGGIYVLGVDGGTASWRLDTRSRTWSAVPAPPFVAVGEPAVRSCAVSADGFLYATGAGGALARLPLEAS